MRAERLIRIAQLLQTRGRLTAGALADELGVSGRTIQRDMEALSLAGIPVYATRGAAGGWEMLDTYRSGFSGLTEDEALAVVVGQQGELLTELGLEGGATAALKVLASLSGRAREHAERARQRVHLDASTWDAREPDPLLPQLHEAVWEDRVVRVSYQTSASEVELEPLGLVAKGATWYLIARRDDRIRTYRVDRVRELTLTDKHFVRPHDFDLVEHWRGSNERFRETIPEYWVTVQVRGEARGRIKWVWAKEKRPGDLDEDGFRTVELDVQNRYQALQTIRLLGNELRVVSPSDLRAAAVADAQGFIATNA